MKKIISSFVFFLSLFFVAAENYKNSPYNSLSLFFGPHEEIAELVSNKTKIPIEYKGLSFYTDRFYFSVLDSNLNFLQSVQRDSDDYIYSIPYIYDDCVMVSRVDSSIEVLMNYENKRFSTLKNNPLGTIWAEEFGIENFDDSSNSVADVFYMIVQGASDYTFVPSRLAYLLRDELGFTEELTISHPMFGIEYRFVMPKSDYKDIEVINSAIIEMLDFNELDDIYLKYGLRARTEPYIKSNIFFTSLIGILFVILFGAVFIMLKIREKNHWREM